MPVRISSTHLRGRARTRAAAVVAAMRRWRAARAHAHARGRGLRHPARAHARRLEVDHQAARHKLARARLGEERLEGVVLHGRARRLLAVGLDAVLQAEELPARAARGSARGGGALWPAAQRVARASARARGRGRARAAYQQALPTCTPAWPR